MLDRRTFLGAACAATGFLTPRLSASSILSDKLPALDYASFLEDCRSTLFEMCEALDSSRIIDPENPDHGALLCPSTDPHEHPLHSRAGEAVQPFAVAYLISGSERYKQAALGLGDWLVRQQNEDGSWHETPDTWRGTTVDQCISLSEALRLLDVDLGDSRRRRWAASVTRAAQWISDGVKGASGFSWSSPLVPTNYLPTAATALVMAWRALGRKSREWEESAGSLISETFYGAFRGVNDDGMPTGEIPWAVDMGYNYDQTLGYLALYSSLRGDRELFEKTARIFESHLYFVYPDGPTDGSWGSRCYKWTTYGSKTAPGPQFLCALLAGKDGRATTAGSLNLSYVQGCMKKGWVGYGPHSWKKDPDFRPCNYPTFARATNLSLALTYGHGPVSNTPAARPLPSHKKWWYEHCPEINVAVVRTDKLMATVSAYKPPLSGLAAAVPQLSYPPRGGVITNLWAEDIGFIQTSSTSVYKREEPMHMPLDHSTAPLTPRIEAEIKGVLFSSLYDNGGPLELKRQEDHIRVTYKGTLQSRTLSVPAGVRYTIVHCFYADRVTKTVIISNPFRHALRIVEPLVKGFPSSLSHDTSSATVIAENWKCKIEIDQSDFPCRLQAHENDELFRPFPSLACYETTLLIAPSREEGSVTYTLRPALC